MSDGPKPFILPHLRTQPEQQFYPQPSPQPVEAQRDWHACGYCEGEIEPGEDAIHWFHGVSGRGRRSNRPMVVDSPPMSTGPGSPDLHLACVPGWIAENYPEIEEILRTMYSEYDEGEPPEEKFCAACEVPLGSDD